MHGFDLLRDPWIPTQRLDGGIEELSLLDTLQQAHDLLAVVEESPIVVFALYRFLVTVCYWHVGLREEQAWSAAWQRGHLTDHDLQRVEEECSGRMGLFDPDRPFLQDALAALSKGEQRSGPPSVAYLFPDLPSGSSSSHFMHGGEKTYAICPACCAKGLLALPPFAVPAGGGPRAFRYSINGKPPVYVMPVGKTLFATILLNTPRPQWRPEPPAEGDHGPTWVWVDTIGEQEERHGDVGLAVGLTWPVRRIRLIPGPGADCSRCGNSSDVLVRGMAHFQGWYRSDEAALWRDPWVTFVTFGEKGPLPLRPRADRATWRDFDALFLSAGKHESARIVEQTASLIDDGEVCETSCVGFQTFALRNEEGRQAAKIVEWRRGTFRFPLVLLHNPVAARAVEEALAEAEKVEKWLHEALQQLDPATERKRTNRQQSREAMRTLRNSTSHWFWDDLEPVFREMLNSQRLQGDSHALAAWTREWLAAVHNRGWTAIEQVLTDFIYSAEALRAAENARATFAGLTAPLRAKIRPEEVVSQ